jgi:hypothetical protein
MSKKTIKKLSVILLFIILTFSCKNQSKNETKIDEGLKINILNARNSTKIVTGSSLYIYKTGESTPCFPPILLEGKTVSISLKKNKHYDFVLSSTENLASSEVKNLYLRDGVNEINIVQLDKVLPDRPTKAPFLKRLYIEVQGKEEELKDGTILNLPLNAKIYANVFSYGGAITELFRGGMSTKLGFGTSPSSVTLKNSPFLSGINPTEIKSIQKDDGWENIFEFELNSHSMGFKDKVDFILLSYDVAGNRLEHHTEIHFNNMKKYQEYPKDDIKIKNVHCNIKTSYSSMNIYSANQENQNTYYFPNFSFEVEGNLVVEVYGIELFRKNKTKNDEFIKVSEVLYNRGKTPPHIIIDTYGGLNIEEEYQYKIRALLKDHFYVDSKMIDVKLIHPFEIELITPNNNAKLTSLSEFTFKITSNNEDVKKLFAKENADYFLFGLLIRSYENKRVFLNTFKYWLDDIHKGDEKIEIKARNGTFTSLSSLKKKNAKLANKSISDFVFINEETGEITIKKDSLIHTNIAYTGNSYDKYTPYYWDICINENKNFNSSITTCYFTRETKNEDINITLTSNVNVTTPTAYSSNGAFSFHLDNGDESSGIISNSYIVKAPDDFSFDFLKSLNAHIVDSLKVSEELNETYYRIKTRGDEDILPSLLATRGIISATHDVAIKLIENSESIEENNIFPFSNKRNMEYYSTDMDDPLLKSCCYSLYITKAFQAYKEFNFENNKVIAGIMDTGINEAHEDFFDTSNNSIITKMNENDELIDNNGHGTHCAGIIAGVGNNGKGIAGVAWKQTHLIPLKMPIDNSTLKTYENILNFVKYIKEKRRNGELSQKTIPFNMSFGSGIPTALSLEVISKALSEGVLPVVAMGNSGSHFINYPAAFPGVIAVGSSNGKDEVSSFSSRGGHISIVAPGENIMSLGKGNERHYYSNHGTSMAAPFVTGAIAYLMNLNPNLSPYQIKTILEDTADKIEGKEDFNTKRGFGRINVYEAAKLIKENKIPAGKFFSGKLEITVSPITTGHVVSIYTSKNVLVALGLTNSDGKAEFRGLLPGTYKVKVKTMDGKIYSRDINILNNSSSDISVAF